MKNIQKYYRLILLISIHSCYSSEKNYSMLDATCEDLDAIIVRLNQQKDPKKASLCIIVDDERSAQVDKDVRVFTPICDHKSDLDQKTAQDVLESKTHTPIKSLKKRVEFLDPLPTHDRTCDPNIFFYKEDICTLWTDEDEYDRAVQESKDEKRKESQFTFTLAGRELETKNNTKNNKDIVRDEETIKALAAAKKSVNRNKIQAILAKYKA